MVIVFNTDISFRKREQVRASLVYVYKRYNVNVRCTLYRGGIRA